MRLRQAQGGQLSRHDLIGSLGPGQAEARILPSVCVSPPEMMIDVVLITDDED